MIYGDTDMMGVVYYANYFRYFEAGRNELLRAAGLTYKSFEEAGFILPVVSAKAKYHASARYDDELLLDTIVNQLRFSSVRIGYKLTRPADGALIATGETRHACLTQDGEIARLPKVMKERLSEAENNHGS